MAETRRFPLLLSLSICYNAAAPWWWWRRNRQSSSPGDTTMLFLGILASIAAIGFLCWLLFTLAIFALPLFAGVSIGTWAYGTGAGWPGAILIGLIGEALTWYRPISADRRTPSLDQAAGRRCLCASGGNRRLSRHTRHRQAHHAVGNLAGHLLRRRCRRHCVSEGGGHGSVPAVERDRGAGIVIAINAGRQPSEDFRRLVPQGIWDGRCERSSCEPMKRDRHLQRDRKASD